jgi:hypothetical protein
VGGENLVGLIEFELNSREIDPDRAVPRSRRLKHLDVAVFIHEQRKEEWPLEAHDCRGDVSQDAPTTRKGWAVSIRGEIGEKPFSGILATGHRRRRELAFKDPALIALLPANVLQDSPFKRSEVQHYRFRLRTRWPATSAEWRPGIFPLDET